MNPTGQFIHATIHGSLSSIAGNIALRQSEAQAPVIEALGEQAFGSLKADMEQRLTYLTTALATNRRVLFDEHLAFLKIAYASRDASLDLLRGGLDACEIELNELLPPSHAKLALRYLREGRAEFEKAPSDLAPAFGADSKPDRIARALLLAVLEFKRDEAIELIEKALAEGLTLPEAYDVLVRVQHETGRLWQSNKLRVSEEHYASGVVEEILVRLRALHRKSPEKNRSVLITSIGGDLHSLGLKIVSNHLEAAGWKTVDLGANTPGSEIADAATAFEVDLVALGASLTPHVIPAAECIALLRADERAKHVPVLIGGGPFALVPDLWRVVGADGSSPSATAAVTMAEELLLQSLI